MTIQLEMPHIGLRTASSQRPSLHRPFHVPPRDPFTYGPFLVAHSPRSARRVAGEGPHGRKKVRFACVRLGPPVPLSAEKTTSPVHGGPVDIFRGGQLTKYPVRYLVGDRVRNILTKYFVGLFVVRHLQPEQARDAQHNTTVLCYRLTVNAFDHVVMAT